MHVEFYSFIFDSHNICIRHIAGREAVSHRIDKPLHRMKRQGNPELQIDLTLCLDASAHFPQVPKLLPGYPACWRSEYAHLECHIN